MEVAVGFELSLVDKLGTTDGVGETQVMFAASADKALDEGAMSLPDVADEDGAPMLAAAAAAEANAALLSSLASATEVMWALPQT